MAGIPPPPAAFTGGADIPPLPVVPASQLTVGWLRGLHWQVVPQRILVDGTHWMQKVEDFKELLPSDFRDLDHSFRTGTQTTNTFAARRAAQLVSVMDARRTQNIEIMLSFSPAPVEEKTAIILNLMRAVLRSPPSKVKAALLASKQSVISTEKRGAKQASPGGELAGFKGADGEQTLFWAGEARELGGGINGDGQVEQDEVASGAGEGKVGYRSGGRVGLGVLEALTNLDALHAVLSRTNDVRTVLTFAETCKTAWKVVHAGDQIWEQMYSAFMHPGLKVSQVGNLLELMVTEPALFLPTDEEKNSLLWYGGDKTKLSPSNLYCMQVYEKFEITGSNADSGSTDPRAPSKYDRFQTMMSYYRIIFQESVMRNSLLDILQAIEEVVYNPSLTKVLRMVLALGHRLDLSRSGRPATSFELKSLRLLRDLKANDQKNTMLHYVVAFISKRDPSALDFVDHRHTAILSEAVIALQRLQVHMPKVLDLWKATDKAENSLLAEGAALKNEFAEVYGPRIERARQYLATQNVSSTPVGRGRAGEEKMQMESQRELLNQLQNLESFLIDISHVIKALGSEDPFNISEEFTMPLETGLANEEESSRAAGSLLTQSTLTGGPPSLPPQPHNTVAPLSPPPPPQQRPPAIPAQPVNFVGADPIAPPPPPPPPLPTPSRNTTGSLPPPPPLPPQSHNTAGPPPPPPPPVARGQTNGPLAAAASPSIQAAPRPPPPRPHNVKPLKKLAWYPSYAPVGLESVWRRQCEPCLLAIDEDSLVEAFGRSKSSGAAFQENTTPVAGERAPWHMVGQMISNSAVTVPKMSTIPAVELFFAILVKKTSSWGRLPGSLLERLGTVLELCLELSQKLASARHANREAEIPLPANYQCVVDMLLDCGMIKIVTDSLAASNLNMLLVMIIQRAGQALRGGKRSKAVFLVHSAVKLQAAARLDHGALNSLVPQELRDLLSEGVQERFTDSFSRMLDFLTSLLEDESNILIVLSDKIKQLSLLHEAHAHIQRMQELRYILKEVAPGSAVRYTLRVILAIGNFLNQNRSAHISGFSIDSCGKLSDVKSNDGRNLFHVVYAIMARDCPQHLRTLQEAEPCLSTLMAGRQSYTKSSCSMQQHWKALVDIASDILKNNTPASHDAAQLFEYMVALDKEIETHQSVLSKHFASHTHSPVFAVHALISGLVSAGRDLRWAQIVHPEGVDRIVKGVIPSVWSRVSELEETSQLLGKDEFCKMVGAIESTLKIPFQRIPRTQQLLATATAGANVSEVGEFITLKVSVPSGGSPLEWSGSSLTTVLEVKNYVKNAIPQAACDQSQIRLFFAGREIHADEHSLQSQAIANGSSLLATIAQPGSEAPRSEGGEAQLSEVYADEAAPIGVRGLLATALPLQADFPTEWLSLALTIDGSGGGGHDEAVVYRNFGGVRRLADGRFHLVEAQGAGDQGLMHIWRYALQGYGHRAAQAQGQE